MFDSVEAFYRPASVHEALRLLQRGKGQTRVVAGGTDLVVEGDRSIRFLIDITHAGLTYIKRKATGLAIGATTTMAELEESALLGGLAGGLLARAAASCGSIQIRNMATLGGNMSNGSPAADMAVPLVALDAKVVIAGPRGRRTMPLTAYLAEPAEMRRRSLLVEVAIPEPPRDKRAGWSFQKFGRTALDIAVVSVAAGIGFGPRGRVKWARLALGAVAPAPLRIAAAEQALVGRVMDRAVMAEACAAVERAVHPITDVRATAEYRTELSRVLSGRALEECAGQAGWAL
jgi:carbon-monoxide dehydrogenase medium subunit